MASEIVGSEPDETFTIQNNNEIDTIQPSEKRKASIQDGNNLVYLRQAFLKKKPMAFLDTENTMEINHLDASECLTTNMKRQQTTTTSVFNPYNIRLMNVKTYNSIKDTDKESIINHLQQNKLFAASVLQIISFKFDRLSEKYNRLSLVVLVISGIITCINATALIINKFLLDNKLDYTNEIIQMSINIIILFLGTILTIFSSVIRFKNYREKIESLRTLQEKLLHIKSLYIKHEFCILYMSMTEQQHDDILTSIDRLDQELNSINISFEISNEEIVKYNRYMSNYRLRLLKIKHLESKKNKIIEKNPTADNLDLDMA